MQQFITIELLITASTTTVWQCLTQPEHIIHWNFAHESWHCPTAQHDLRIGGQFNYRMESNDGEFGFNYTGTFDQIQTEAYLAYHLDDGRKVTIELIQLDDNNTLFREVFEADKQQDIEMQRQGWLAIAKHLRQYGETFPFI